MPSPADHAATIREALDVWDARQEARAEMTETEEARDALAALVTQAEQADEAVRVANEMELLANGARKLQLASDQRADQLQRDIEYFSKGWDLLKTRAERAETALRRVAYDNPTGSSQGNLSTFRRLARAALADSGVSA